MPDHLVYRNALAYMGQWYVADRRYMGILSTSTVANTAPGRMKKLAAKYMVARNFVSKELGDAGSDWYWGEVVRCVSDAANMATVPVAEAITAQWAEGLTWPIVSTTEGEEC